MHAKHNQNLILVCCFQGIPGSKGVPGMPGRSGIDGQDVSTNDNILVMLPYHLPACLSMSACPPTYPNHLPAYLMDWWTHWVLGNSWQDWKAWNKWTASKLL